MSQLRSSLDEYKPIFERTHPNMHILISLLNTFNARFQTNVQEKNTAILILISKHHKTAT